MFYYFQAIVLGAVQGITEFLPISSTAHLIVLENIFHLSSETYGLSFDMFTNLGTLAAVLCFFWKDLRSIFSRLRFPTFASPLSEKERLPWRILVITGGLVIIGYFSEDIIAIQLRSLSLIATTLILVGLLMLIAEKIAAGHSQPSQELTAKRTYLIGFSQALAFIPGVSRSGITITSGLFSGLDRITAARYSFLLSIPITAAAVGKRMLTFSGQIIENGIITEVLIFYLLGVVSAGLIGYFTIKFLLAFLSHHSLNAFAFYRFGLGGFILLFLT